MKHYIILILAILLYTNCFLFGQEQVYNPYGNSANSIANFSTNRSIPNLYTGALNVEIPLHTIELDGKKIPIALQYHTTGVKPDVRPGWVGLNWNLACGGEITRVVHDLPDDYNNPDKFIERILEFPTLMNQLTGTYSSDKHYGEELGFYYSHHLVRDYNRSKAADYFENHYQLNDTESDEYHFTLPGYSGSFIIDEDGYFRIKSQPGLKVELNGFAKLPHTISGHGIDTYISRNSSYHLRTFMGFTITTEDGTKYIFGAERGSEKSNIEGYEESVFSYGESDDHTNITNGIEYSIPFNSQYKTEWTAMTWKLTKIITPNDRVINFIYEPKEFTCQMDVSMQYDATDIYNCYYNDPDGYRKAMSVQAYGKGISTGCEWNLKSETADILRKLCILDYIQYTNDFIHPRFASYKGNLIRPTYLRKINCETETVEFNISESNELNYELLLFIKLFPSTITDDMTDYVRMFLNYLHDGALQQFGYQYLKCVSRSLLGLDCDEFDALIENLERIIEDLPGNSMAPYWYNWPFLYAASNSDKFEDLIDVMKWYKLNNIKITNNIDKSITKQLKFSYNDIETERLMLKGITTKGTDANSLTHSFSYYPGTLPGYCAERTDHWGYFNNISSFLTDFRDEKFWEEISNNVLEGPDDQTSYFTTRNSTSDINIATRGSLKEIHYPTGGKEEFIYELNNYNKLLEENILINKESNINTGGIRISQVKKYENNNATPLVTKYYYNKTNLLSNISASLSSGTLHGEPDYYIKTGYDFTDEPLATTSTTRYIFSSQSYNPLSSNNNGNHVTYSRVLVKNPDNSYLVYYFTDIVDYDGETHIDYYDEYAVLDKFTTHTPHTSKAIERGKIKKIEYRDHNEKLVKEEIYSYEKSSDLKSRSLKFDGFISQCATATSFYFSAISYDHLLYNYQLKTKTINSYNTDNSGESFSKRYEYSYDNYGQIISSKLLQNAQIIDETIYRYPTYYTFDNYVPYRTYNDDPSVAITFMNLKNIRNKPIEVIKKRGNNVVGAKQYKYKVNNLEYSLFFSDIVKGQVITEEILDYELLNPFNYSNYIGGNLIMTYSNDPLIIVPESYSFNPDNNFKSFVTYNLFDDYANLLERTEKGGLKSSYIWDNLGIQPIAEIVNAANNEVYYTGFEEDLDDNKNTDSRSGDYSYKVMPDKFSPGNELTFSRGKNKGNYKLSTWVKTQNGYIGNTHLVIDVRTLTYDFATYNGSSAWITTSLDSDTKGWQLVEKEIDFNKILDENPGIDYFIVRIYLWNTSTSHYILIDDMRFHPSDAFMTSYSYRSQIGKTSMTDARGVTAYYEYDGLGRTKTEKDYKKNILKAYAYNYKEAAQPCIIPEKTFIILDLMEYTKDITIIKNNVENLTYTTNNSGILISLLEETDVYDKIRLTIDMTNEDKSNFEALGYSNYPVIDAKITITGESNVSDKQLEEEINITRERGIKGRYYSNRDSEANYIGDLQGVYTDIIDNQIGFNWDETHPHFKNFQVNNFSISWESLFYVDVSNTYTFKLVSDDGITMQFNDDEKIIDNYGESAGTKTAIKYLEKGKIYKLRINYKEHKGDASVWLKWSSPDLPEQIIPAKYFIYKSF